MATDRPDVALAIAEHFFSDRGHLAILVAAEAIEKLLEGRDFEAGRVYAQTEIRQALIAEAARLDQLDASAGRLAAWESSAPSDGGAEALWTFAAGLIGLKAEG